MPEEKHRHPDINRLFMFKRERSPYWWCGFHHKSKYLRTSTKSEVQVVAEKFAFDWYLEQQVLVREGKLYGRKKPPTVKDASIRAVNDYRVLVKRGEKSKAYLESIIRFQNKHVLPHFGDMVVSDVTTLIWREFVRDLYLRFPNIANNTVHQIRNALAVCLNAAEDAGWIKAAPRLRERYKVNQPTKRIWFEPAEQKALFSAIEAHINKSKGTTHANGSLELRDYVLWLLRSGLRVGEANQLTFGDIEEYTDNRQLPHIKIHVSRGKRGSGLCVPDRSILHTWEALKSRREPWLPENSLFERHHREMFNAVLNDSGLKEDTHGRKRDFVSLRHTYISNKIRERVPVFEIAHNCRTSPAMIEKHYAKHMSPEFFESLNAEVDKRLLQISRYEKANMASSRIIEEKLEELEQLTGLSKGELLNPSVMKRLMAELKVGGDQD